LVECIAHEDGTIGVFSTCPPADGSINSTIKGAGRVVDVTTNANLQVSFPNVPIPGDYRIIDLGRGCQHAVVGDPRRLTPFILSRTPTFDPATLGATVSRLPHRGYDSARVVDGTPIAVRKPSASPRDIDRF